MSRPVSLLLLLVACADKEQPSTPPGDDDSTTPPAPGMEGAFGGSGDADWYAASGDQGSEILFRCWTDRFGSTAELDVEAYVQGVLFAQGTEPDENETYLQQADLPATGPFEIRILPNSEGGASDWYRCALFVAPP